MATAAPTSAQRPAPDAQKTQPPAQQQAPPLLPANAHQLLDSMQAMLNGALLEVGHSMKNPARPSLTFPSTQGFHGPKFNNISISASYERFHTCLDDIENELFRAKAVLRRDLALRREEREKREKAEQERAAEAAQKIAAEKKAAPAPAPAAQQQQKKKSEQPDVSMADAPAQAAAKTAKTTADQPSVAAHTHLPPRPPAIQTNTTGAATDGSAQPAPATATSTDDLFGRTPTTAGMGQTDFDSMFEDFANDNNAGGNLDTANANATDEFDFGIGILPGLESYANSDNNKNEGQQSSTDAAGGGLEIDFSGLDNAQTSQAQEDQKKKEEEEKKQKEEEKKKEEENKKKEEGQQQQDNQDLNDVFGGDSTFDDLFNYTDFDMGGGGSTGGGDTTFDDDFFNI